MECPRCGEHNLEGAKFCNDCGQPLTAICRSCAHANPPGSRFCNHCGEALAPAPQVVTTSFRSPETFTPKHLAEQILASRGALEGERKRVTVLFADLKGSMELLADRDPEDARRLLDPVLERMIEAVHRYEGTVNHVMGDGIMALFGAPLAHEDHAVRACYAALRMQDEAKRYADRVRRTDGVPLSIRIGLNSGEVVVRSIGSDLKVDYTAVGQTTHLAARMEQMAMPGSILMAPQTLRLAEGFIEVRSLGPSQVRGLSDPLEVFELVGATPVRSRLEALARGGLTRFVGRDHEIAQVCLSLDRARDAHGQVVAVVGEPGVGKSRLTWEVVHSHHTRGWLVLESRSLSYGKATPYLPLIDLLKGYCRIQNDDDPRSVREKMIGKILALDRMLEPHLPQLLGLLGVAPEGDAARVIDAREQRQRILDAVKRLLLRESQVQPVLVVFEDLHWVDAETQALIDGLVESLPAARVVLLVNYRPEYQHAWTQKTYYRQIRLDPFAPENAEELLSDLLGNAPGLTPLKSLLIERTGGNAFFLEESVHTLVETGALVGGRGTYHAEGPIDAIRVPATVHAMLASRIDRLPQGEKRLLQTAAVVGKDVPHAILEAVADLSAPRLRDGLAHLQAAEFLYETRLFPDLEYTFKHALTHEVAYGSLLQQRRRDVHRCVGEALERLTPERLAELSDVLARHFLEAGILHKGMAYSIGAARRAEVLFAHEEALRHYQHARAAAETLKLAGEIAAIDEEVGDVHTRRAVATPAAESYGRALERTEGRSDRARLKAKIGRVYGLFGDQRGMPYLQEALKELDPAAQQRELAQATAMAGRYCHYAGRHGMSLEYLERARLLAEGLDDPETLALLYGYIASAYFHLARFTDGVEWASRSVEVGERSGFPWALRIGYEYQAESLYLLGRWEESLRFSARNREISTQMGDQSGLAWAYYDTAWILHWKGSLAAALDAAQSALTSAQQAGERRVEVFIKSCLCALHAALGDDKAAGGQGRAAIVLADDLGDPIARAGGGHALAYLHIQQEDWDRASELFEEIDGLLADSDNKFTRLFCGAHTAEALWGSRRFEAALRSSDTALALARAAGSKPYEGLAQRVRGQVLASLERWDEAGAAFDAAAAILEALGARVELGRALYHRAVLHRLNGNGQAMREDAQRALTIFADAGAHRDYSRAERLVEKPLP